MNVFENIMGKGENAGDQRFLLFPQCFSNSSKVNFNCREQQFIHRLEKSTSSYKESIQSYHLQHRN